jgi:hypothetical protein
MVAFQMSAGSPDPYTGPPQLFTSGTSPLTVPTQTAVDSCGVYPTIHASRFCPVSPSWCVPVLAATGRPPASVWPLEYPAMGSIAEVTLSATSAAMRRWPLSSAVASKSTSPLALTTFCTKCGGWKMPEAANVA